MDKKMLDIYTDYEIASFSKITATGLSELLDNAISHDQITRFLNNEIDPSKELWQLVKPLVKKVQNDDGVIIFDDTVQEKQYSKENNVICWHYDHCIGRTVKGINMLSCIYYVPDITIPIAIEVIKKYPTEDKKTHEIQKKAKQTKNEYMLDMLKTCIRNQIKFKYVISDSWFSSKENLKEIKENMKKDFIMAIKSNRNIALNLTNKHLGKFQTIKSLNIPANSTCTVYLKGLDFQVKLSREVFKNKDESIGERYLVSSDLSLTFKDMTTIYKRRWKVEEYHKSIKSNCGFSKSPTHTNRSQIKHLFTSVYAFVKLEKLRLNTNLNHFALKNKIYIKALQNSLKELNSLKNHLVF